MTPAEFSDQDLNDIADALEYAAEDLGYRLDNNDEDFADEQDNFYAYERMGRWTDLAARIREGEA